jgi:hypothetical protein
MSRLLPTLRTPSCIVVQSAAASIIGVAILVAAGCTPRDSDSKSVTSWTTIAPATSPTSVWSPDPMYLEKLGPAEQVGAYRIRPPQGYTLQKTQRGGTQSFIWEGPARPDRSTPKLWVMVGRMAPGEEKLSLVETNSMLLAGAKKKVEQYSETPAVLGKIGKLPFLRITFQGMEKGPAGHKGHTVAYHAHDAQQYIHIMVMDVEPHWVDSFSLLETAARTFDKP